MAEWQVSCQPGCARYVACRPRASDIGLSAVYANSVNRGHLDNSGLYGGALSACSTHPANPKQSHLA